MKRRQVLKLMGASLVALHTPSLSARATVPVANKKLVWIMLRGALDSLHWLPPTQESSRLMALRPNLYGAIKDDVLPLNQQFALHPSLKTVHRWYQQKQALAIVATYTGYQKRSHFEAQDFLEQGGNNVDYTSGWLARLVTQLNTQSLAVARSTPLSLRGQHNNLNWFPANIPQSEDGLFDRLMELYQDTPILAESLAQGVKLDSMTDIKHTRRAGRFPQLAGACGKLLRENPAIQVSMLELGGWDTHNQQPTKLKRRLDELDQGLAQLKLSLADQWQDTLVVVATEFGRTVAENGTLGTDHGTASAMLLTGGAVQGGQVLGTWPGLEQSQLFAGRDLAATSNTYQWINTALTQHFNLTPTQVSAIHPQRPFEQVKLVTTTQIA